MKIFSKDTLAHTALKACFTREGIIAGTHHFVDLWARDSLFATFGANVIGHENVSKKTIQTFLSYQRSDGLIPYLILRSKHTIGKYFHRPRYFLKPVPVFRSHMSFGIVPDGGLMTIIAMRSYVEHTKDRSFLKRHYMSLVRAFFWYEHRFGKGLVREWFQCEWADALLKSGNTLYTNVLYFKAASDMSWMAAYLGKQMDANRYAIFSKHIQKLINDTLWTGSFYADWKDWKRQDYFATHPNMLAIIFGLTTKKQAASILSKAKKDAWNGWTLVNSTPEYPFWRVTFLHILIGLHDYHNGFIWLQPGILYSIALFVCKKRTEAKKVLLGIEDKIISFNGAYEVYERNSSPVRRRIYTSEHPFAWSAGLFVWAQDMLMVKKSV